MTDLPPPATTTIAPIWQTRKPKLRFTDSHRFCSQHRAEPGCLSFQKAVIAFY